MASFRGGMDPECGGPSPAINLASHFTQDRAFQNEGFATNEAESLVNEFLEETVGASAHPFHMGSLLDEVNSLGNGLGPSATSWVSEYTTHELSEELSDENEEDYYDVSDYHGQSVRRVSPVELAHQTILDEIGDLLDFSDTSLSELAQKLVVEAEDLNHDGILTSEFMQTMAKIGNAADRKLQMKAGVLVNDHEEREGSARDKADFDYEKEKEFWSRLSTQWETLNNRQVPDSVSTWESEFDDYIHSFKEYSFAHTNPLLLSGIDPLAEGEARLASGDLPGAVLCFESAVLKDSDNARAWLLLGTTQAKNEQDPQAIAALKKCLTLDPNNLIALMDLAVCYTNESYQAQACRTLKEWLRAHPKYSDLASPDEDPEDKLLTGISTIMPPALFQDVVNSFLAAAMKQPDTIDPDIQCGLGVLYNLSGEADRAADCFSAALLVNPKDSRLWNRLGATLANGSRSEEAVEAYRQALELSPGFVRARYNLAITCIQLKAHREAAEHLLTALGQQVSGVGASGERSLHNMSDSIWTTLRIVISLLERPDLMPAVNSRDLKALNEAFLNEAIVE